MSRKTFKYRLYPNRLQRERLQTTLDLCRELYNARCKSGAPMFAELLAREIGGFSPPPGYGN